VPDENEPTSSPVWCPIEHLVGAPRPFVCVLGLTTRFWPRRNTEDPLLPTRIVEVADVEGQSIRQRDEAQLAFLRRMATGEAVLSFARRDARGSILTASPSLPQDVPQRVFTRTRIPLQAFSESDRLLARPRETVALIAPASATRAWNDWRKAAITDHDGRITANHPAIDRALSRIQSATSLRLLFRDPLAFIWRYALDWQAPAVDDRPLERDSRGFGVLVHALLKRTVDLLEPVPGLGRASEAVLEAALDQAVAELRSEWPLEHPVPPLMLWDHTLAEARNLARRGLTFDAAPEAISRTFAEVTFGRATSPAKRGDVPWPPEAVVVIPETSIQLRGEIDRLDFLGGRRVRVTDYKTGMEPPKVEKLVLNGGKDLQRVIYALAVRTLLRDMSEGINARLIYLGEGTPREHSLIDVDQAIAGLRTNVLAAAEILRRGLAFTNPEPENDWDDFRLALPSVGTGYLRAKARAIKHELGRAPHRSVP
jgi:RecB family exonuclease